jgi:hypothetical protein
MSEYWVDVPKVEMAPPNTWHTLSLNQLLEVKNQLLDKIYMSKGKAMYLKPLNEALQRLEVLLAQKMNDPRGSN